MKCTYSTTILAVALLVLLKLGPALCARNEREIIWCTVNEEEQKKCMDVAEFLRTDNQQDTYGRPLFYYRLNCTMAPNKDECMIMIDNEFADVTTLDAGETFMGGRYNSLVPIMHELYKGDSGSRDRIFAVAIVRKSSNVRSVRDLRGKKACFGGVGSLAGWIVPVSELMKQGGMEISDCNNHVKSVSDFFGESCAVNSLSDKYNPLGDNSDKLCQICGSDAPGIKCTSQDPYAGYQGAISCLINKGEVAFVKHSAVTDYFDALTKYTDSENRKHGDEFLSPDLLDRYNERTRGRDFSSGRQLYSNYSSPGAFRPDSRQIGPFDRRKNSSSDSQYFRPQISLQEFLQNFELLCLDGTTRSVQEWKTCYWDDLPAHAVVTSSGKSVDTRTRYQRFFRNLVDSYGKDIGGFNEAGQELVNIFHSVPRYGNRSNLLFQDDTESLKPIQEEDQTYQKYLGRNEEAILFVRTCPVGKMTLCVTSQPEFAKCIRMRTALSAQLLKPEMICYQAHSQMACMEAIQKGDADAAVMDAGDVYTAGYIYDLVPVLAETYNLGTPEYYAVAVAYQGDPDTDLTYLKGRTSCHSGVGHAAGWVMPMAYLITSGRIRKYGCDSLLAASQYFSKSCVPGALSNEFSMGGEYHNLCFLCSGSSSAYCSRQAAEQYYGFTGAFRCLVEGGGQVAFVKHTTVSEVTNGKRRETWARNTLAGDYELMCRDGTRAPVTDYERCNLGRVKANAVVMRGGDQYNDTTTHAYINLFLYAQQLYGSKYEDDFKFAMFYSHPPYSDLIFQDAAQQLIVLPQEQRHYQSYLGKNFLRARALVDCRSAGSLTHAFSITLVLGLLTTVLTHL